jgi:hypothetical protein
MNDNTDYDMEYVVFKNFEKYFSIYYQFSNIHQQLKKFKTVPQKFEHFVPVSFNCKFFQEVSDDSAAF